MYKNKRAFVLCYCMKLAQIHPFSFMETTGIEPVTPCMSSKYSNQLSYASKVLELYHISLIIAILF